METAAPMKGSVRPELGKGPARRLRATGMIPAVVYGCGITPTSLTVDPDDVRDRLTGEYGRNALFRLELDNDDSHVVRVGAYQRDPVKRAITHVDFLVVDPKRVLKSEVPLELTGKPAGVEQGGLLRQLRRTVTIFSTAENIPAKLSLDVSALRIGNVLQASAVDTPEGVELDLREDYGVAMVYVPRGIEEVEDEEDEDEEDEEGEEEGGETAEE